MSQGMSRFGRQFLLKHDDKDTRDHFFLPRVMLEKLPDAVDLRAGLPEVWEQGTVGSCAPHAACAAFCFADKLLKPQSVFMPSRKGVYYDARLRECSEGTDTGCTLRDTIVVGYKIGYGSETLWPYHSPTTQKPTGEYYTDAEKHQVTEYLAVQQYGNQMLSCLAQGFPFMFGSEVYSSLEDADTMRTGMVPMPRQGWLFGDKFLGRHAMLACGYDLKNQKFIVRNSWGVNCGDEGYFYFPLKYLFSTKLVSDCWTIRVVEE